MVRALAAAAVVTLAAAAAGAAEPAWRYQVAVGPEARELRVEATLAAGGADELSVDDGAEPFVRDVAVDDGGGWRPVPPHGTSWLLPGCRARGCRLRYRFELARAAASLSSEAAQRFGAVTQAPPSTWLLHPLRARAGRDYRFTVTTPPGLRFVTGVRRVAPGEYGADVATLRDAPYSAFGPLDVASARAGGATLDFAFIGDGDGAPAHAPIVGAMSRAADVVARYFHRFPVERLLVLVIPTDGDDVHGRTLGGGGATLLLFVGRGVDGARLASSWVPAHELVHLGFPTVRRDELWIAEGLATYVEPIARARAGDLGAEKVWRDLVDGLPEGLPGPGDRGLDHTHTWGRTYWGGALFCMLADVEIRERTHNRRSLDDALRAIVAAGGTLAESWPLERALRVGDEAVGVPVLVPLRERMGRAPGAVDLAALWPRLGVAVRAGRVVFDEAAPLAAVRRAITDGK